MNAQPDLLSHRAAATYLKARLGDAAPSRSTLQTYARPAHTRARRERGLPDPVRIPGLRKVLWRRSDLDAFIGSAA